MTVLQCSQCKNYLGALKCLAYPDGIPEAIIGGDNDHTEPYEGDGGILFEPVDA